MKFSTIRRQMFRNIQSKRVPITFIFKIDFLRQNKDKRTILQQIMREHTEFAGEWIYIYDKSLRFCYTGKLHRKYLFCKSVKQTYNRLKHANIPVVLSGSL
ncbi:MAG: hypothetical protein RIS64_3607 [Bacteroidota bacterium]|jgi:hypothetical protein